MKRRSEERRAQECLNPRSTHTMLHCRYCHTYVYESEEASVCPNCGRPLVVASGAAAVDTTPNTTTGMSRNMKLNLSYGAALAIALVILILVGFVGDNALGYVVWMVTAVLGGILVLWQKRRLNTGWIWFLLFFTAGFGFPIGVLCLRAEEGG